MRSNAFFAAAVALTCAGSSFAEEPAHTKVIVYEPPAFAEVDTDGDRMITAGEFTAFIERHRRPAKLIAASDSRRATEFTRADRDGDGMLSREEFDNMPRRVVRRTMAKADPADLFEKGDTDLDGVLNEDEFEALMGAVPRLRRHSEDTSEQRE